MQDLLVALPRLVVALLLLQLFFGLIQTEWPTSYYGTADLVAARVSRTWYRYTVFRFGPVLLAATLVAATGPIDSHSEFVAAAAFGVAHGLLTSGRSLLMGAIRHRTTARQVLVDLAVLIGVLLVSLAGATVSPLVRQYLPGVDKYVEVFLTGIVAAIAYSYISRWTTNAGPTLSVAEQLAALPDALVALVAEAAARHRVDRDLALAILLMEQRQRPQWIRVFERRLGYVNLARSHGPYQNMTDPTVTDQESVEAAMANIAGAVLPRKNGYMYSPARLDYHLERHNRSKIFIESCSSIYHELTFGINSATDRISVDGTPLVRLIEKRREGNKWHLFGDVGSDVVTLTARVLEPSVRPVEPVLTGGRFHRQIWRLTLSIEDEAVQITPLVLGDVGLAMHFDQPMMVALA